MEKILKLLKSKTVKNIVYYTGNGLLRIIYSVIAVFCRVSDNKIVFFNYNGKGYGDNPKYAAKKLHELNPDIEMVWMVQNPDLKMPEYIKQVKMFSVSGMIECASAKVWVSNARLHLYLWKKGTQKYFQLWHGGCGPKKVEGAAAEKLINWYLSSAKHDSEMADYFVSNSRFNSEMIRSSFWYDGEILEYGSPRHDPFFSNDKNIRAAVESDLKIGKNQKVILYAPTFRDDKGLDIYRWNYKAFLDAVKEQMGGDWCFVLRLHPNISFLDNEFNYESGIINGSHYDDMQELIQRSDIVITDYSGVMMQAALAGKYVLLLIPDKDKYMDERGLCIDIDKSPFPMGCTCEELIKNVAAQDFDRYQEDLRAYLEEFGFFDDGCASERVAYKIQKCMNK